MCGGLGGKPRQMFEGTTSVSILEYGLHRGDVATGVKKLLNGGSIASAWRNSYDRSKTSGRIKSFSQGRCPKVRQKFLHTIRSKNIFFAKLLLLIYANVSESFSV